MNRYNVRMNVRKYGIIFLVGFSLLLVAAAPPAEGDLPNYYFIDMQGRAQSLSLSCESRSAADLANYWGISVEELDFFESLPKSDNPEKGFVGNVRGTWGQIPPNPYGVHAQPVARQLRLYGLEATAHKGFTFEQLRNEIANGRPVIVWVIGRVWQGTPLEYTAVDGTTTTVARYEHTMIVYGYDKAAVYLIDAASGASQKHSIQNFKKSWNVLGRMAVTAVGPDPEPVSINKSGTYLVQSGDYLTKLAAEWGIPWQDLAALNGINYPYTLYPGQVLIMGVDPQPSPTPKATKEPGNTPTSVQKATATDDSRPTAEPPATATPKPTATSATGEKPNRPSPKTYTVQRGDHLMKIARQLELDWKEIAGLNSLSYPYLLYPGQVLKLPSSEDSDHPSSGAEDDTQSNQNPASGGGKTYVVQPGEYIYSLARRFEVSWQLLASINGISYPYIVHPGEVLVLP